MRTVGVGAGCRLGIIHHQLGPAIPQQLGGRQVAVEGLAEAALELADGHRLRVRGSRLVGHSRGEMPQVATLVVFLVVTLGLDLD